MSETNTHLPYLAHRNGRGRIFDESEACSRSYVDRESQVSDDSSIWASRIEHSRIFSTVVSDSVIKNSWIRASEIHRAEILNSIIACEFVGTGAQVDRCTVLGKSRIANNAVCHNVRFRDLTVKGPAVLCDWPQTEDETFDGSHGYILRGTWPHPPQIFKVSPTITLTEGVCGFVVIHCREYEINHLLRIGHRLGRASGWTPDEIKTVRKIAHRLLTSKRR